MPVRDAEFPCAILTSAFFASARALSPHVSRYAWISPSFFFIASKYSAVSSAEEYSLASSARLASAIVSFERSILFSFSGKHLLYRNTIPFPRRRGFQKSFRILPTHVWILIRTYNVAETVIFCLP